MPWEWCSCPKVPTKSLFCKTTFEASIKDQKLEILGWRTVPVDASNLGQMQLKEPTVQQVFVGKMDWI
jgi:glutamate synthase (ferredoxin)